MVLITARKYQKRGNKIYTSHPSFQIPAHSANIYCQPLGNVYSASSSPSLHAFYNRA